jgi:hypothetical protein
VGGPQWFALRYGTVSKHLLNRLSLGPDRSGVVVNDAEVGIAMGRSFNGRAPRSTVTSARALAGTVLSRGVHGWRGDWLVNGAGNGLVELLFDPPLKARVLAFPVSVRRLRVSVDDPDGLVEAIGAGAGADHGDG